jgi:hypothetical protein
LPCTTSVGRTDELVYRFTWFTAESFGMIHLLLCHPVALVDQCRQDACLADTRVPQREREVVVGTDLFGQGAQLGQADTEGRRGSTDPFQGRYSLRLAQPSQFRQEFLNGQQTTVQRGGKSLTAAHVAPSCRRPDLGHLNSQR